MERTSSKRRGWLTAHPLDFHLDGALRQRFGVLTLMTVGSLFAGVLPVGGGFALAAPTAAETTAVVAEGTAAAADSGRAEVAEAADTLARAAQATGRYFGVGVASNRFTDPVYAGIVDREFDSISPENEMKIDALEPSPNVFTFAIADQLVSRAKAHGQRVRAHNLVWHSAPPAWMANLRGPQLRDAVANHITTVLTHFKGKIYAWDVVDEAFADNGTPRDTMFRRELGPGYIEEAFRTARAADPAAKLCYQDYNIEDLRTAKTSAVYAMVKDFKQRGVPIDCVGMQSHFLYPYAQIPTTLRQTIEQFAALGVDVELTQLDIDGSGQQQADKYRQVVSACLAVRRCTGITVWGVRDIDSWRPANTPLLFDKNGNKKPAYYATLEALNQAAGTASTTS